MQHFHQRVFCVLLRKTTQQVQGGRTCMWGAAFSMTLEEAKQLAQEARAAYAAGLDAKHRYTTQELHLLKLRCDDAETLVKQIQKRRV